MCRASGERNGGSENIPPKFRISSCRQFETSDFTVDLLEQQRNVIVVEGEASAEHNVENDTTTPDIDFWSGVESSKLDVNSWNHWRE